jgi:hypothetical protein
MEKVKQRRKLLVDASTRDHAECLFALKLRLDELHAELAAISRQGWATCRELDPVLKFDTWVEISFKPFVTTT